jgi:hypothetical protein
VRHAAAVGQVSVLLDAQAKFTEVAPAGEASAVVPAGQHEIQVNAMRTGEVLAAPQNVELPNGTANFMYLIGSQAEGTLGWAAVQIGNLSTAPERIDTGDGSTERSLGRDRRMVLFAAIIGLGAVTILLGTRRYVTRSSRGDI